MEVGRRHDVGAGFEECVGVYHVKGEWRKFFRQEVQTKLRL